MERKVRQDLGPGADGCVGHGSVGREEELSVHGHRAVPISASHVGAFTSIRIVSRNDGRGWSLFRVRGRSDRVRREMLRAGTTT